MSKPSVVRQPFSFFFVLFCKYVFKKRSYSRILYYELNVLLLPVDSLNISMFRFPLRKRIYIDIYIYICMYEKAFGWLFGSFGISKPCYMYFHCLPVIFYYSVSWRICSTLRAWIKPSNPLFALVVSGPTLARSSKPSVAVTRLFPFFLACIVCMREARYKHEKDPLHDTEILALLLPSPPLQVWSMEYPRNETNPSGIVRFFFPPAHRLLLTRCHVAQLVWLNSWSISRRICV